MAEQILLVPELETDQIPPPGFRYVENILSPEEEKDLISYSQTLKFQPYVMRGQASKRGIVRFGSDYGRPVGGVSSVVPKIPEELITLRDRAARVADADPKGFTSAVFTHYPVGATIGWHSDMPMFGSVVLGISMNSEAQLKVRKIGNASKKYQQILAPRSLFIMSGQVRKDWQHSIPPVKAVRYSITFRSLISDDER